jgi:hypothetical protein
MDWRKRADNTMAKQPDEPHQRSRRWRSQFWFDNPENPEMTALNFERYLNFGLTKHEIASRRPIIGIAQSGYNLSPHRRSTHTNRLESRRGRFALDDGLFGSMTAALARLYWRALRRLLPGHRNSRLGEPLISPTSVG